MSKMNLQSIMVSVTSVRLSAHEIECRIASATTADGAELIGFKVLSTDTNLQGCNRQRLPGAKICSTLNGSGG